MGIENQVTGTEAQGNTQASTTEEPKTETPRAGLLDEHTADKATEEGSDAAAKNATEKDEQAKAGEVPETYAPFNMEEGFGFDEASGKKFMDLAKTNKLTQENAQAFVDLATEHVKSLAAKQMEEYGKIRDEWVKELKSDSEYGGAKFDETVIRAKRALKTFVPVDESGKPKFDLMGVLKTTGLVDNPALIKFLAHIDKATGEDKVIKGGSAEVELSTAEVLFGKK